MVSMNEAHDSQPSRRFAGSFDDLASVELPPTTGWVVHEVLRSRSGLPQVWAWCRVSDDHPGYSEVVYTLNDGVTSADPGTNPQLGPVIVKVFC